MATTRRICVDKIADARELAAKWQEDARDMCEVDDGGEAMAMGVREQVESGLGMRGT